jgi:hypothetical protein
MFNVTYLIPVIASLVVDVPPEAETVEGQYEVTHRNVELQDDILKVGNWVLLDGWPKGWDDLSAFEEDYATTNGSGGKLTLNATGDGTEVAISTTIDLPREVEFLTFVVRFRGPELECGETDGAGGGVTFSVVDYKGQTRVMPRIEPPYNGSINWSFNMQTVRILEGETKLQVKVSIRDAVGILEVEDIYVMPSDPTNEASEEEQRALATAIRNDDAEAVGAILRKNPQLLECRTGIASNGTPLIIAAQYNSVKVAVKLIESGAYKEAVDQNWNNTPLRWCCWMANPEVAAVLVDAGAKTAGIRDVLLRAMRRNQSSQSVAERYARISEIFDAHESE